MKERKIEEEDLCEEVKAREFVHVFSHNKNGKPRIFDKEEIIYCALDNHRCDGICREVNSDKHGNIVCSEPISSKFLPKKKAKKKKRKFRNKERDRNDNFDT